MTAVAFDTLRFVRTLRDKAKMPQEQAEGLADAVAEAIQADLATKADIEALRLATKTDFAAVRTDIEALRLTVAKDMEALNGRIELAKAETIKWVTGLIGFQTVALIGAAVALAKSLH